MGEQEGTQAGRENIDYSDARKPMSSMAAKNMCSAWNTCSPLREEDITGIKKVRHLSPCSKKPKTIFVMSQRRQEFQDGDKNLSNLIVHVIF